MTKIKFTAAIFATIIIGATHSLSAQTVNTSAQNTQTLVSQMNGQINGLVAPGGFPNAGPIDQNNFGSGQAVGSSVEAAQYNDNMQLGETYFQESAPQPAHSSMQDVGPVGRLFASNGKHRVWGVTGLALSRKNFNDSVQVANGLFSGDVTQGDVGGIDLSLATRSSAGKGWEARYFGLFEETTAAQVAPSATTLNGLANVNTAFGTGLNLVNVPGNIHSLSRTSQLHNVEFNLLRQGKSQLLGIPVNMNESIYGFRYLQFNESLNYGSSNLLLNNQLTHEAENTLLGFQLGRRVEKSLFGRVGLSGFGKIGVYNNNAQARRAFTVSDASGVLETARDFTDTKNDVAFLGELDLGGTYQFTNSFRAKIGYRMLAASGLAIADGQINNDFVNNSSVNTNDDLYLEGGYFGLEFVR